MPTLVYNFPCKVLSNEAAIDKQIGLGHKYYNTLAFLHRANYDDYIAILCAFRPDYNDVHARYVAAKAKVKELKGKILGANAKARKKRSTQEESEELSQAFRESKEATAARKELAAAIRNEPDVQAALAKLYIDYHGEPKPGGKIREGNTSSRRYGGKFKEARAECGMYWGTYNRIEAAAEQAKESTKFGPMKTRKWNGDGLISVQVQHGATVSDLLSGSGNIKGLLRWDGMKARGKNRCRHVTLTMKVDSENTTQVRISMTRDLPMDANIREVTLVRRGQPPHRVKDGWKQRYSWSLQFTLVTAETKQRAVLNACGIDLGWRRFEDGSMRVAYLHGNDGFELDFRLPPFLVSAWDKVDSLQSIRSRNFNDIIDKVSDWKAAHKELPEWFTEMTRFMNLWEAKGKMARLIDHWDANPIDDDEWIRSLIRDWRAQDVHLWQWEFHQAKKAQRDRLQMYRLFVADVRKRYSGVAVEDCDWRKLLKDKKVDDNSFDPSKRPAKIASVGKLRDLLCEDGAIPVATPFTTKTCNVCGSIEEWDQAKEITHKCSNCGETWDQDQNAAINLMRLMLEGEEEDEQAA